MPGVAMAAVSVRMLSILHRPDIVRERQQFGHWECDLMQFKKKFGEANVTSLVERVSRFTVFLRNNDRQSRPIMERADPHAGSPARNGPPLNHLRPWHRIHRLALSPGRALGTQTWFCDPQSPWQKGTVENTNRRARKMAFEGG